MLMTSSNRQGTSLGSIDLSGTGSRIFLTIISNNLRVYNTRVRSDCGSKRSLKNSRFPLVYNRRACITAWKLRESCIAEKMSLLALGPVILGEI